MPPRGRRATAAMPTDPVPYWTCHLCWRQEVAETRQASEAAARKHHRVEHYLRNYTVPADLILYVTDVGLPPPERTPTS